MTLSAARKKDRATMCQKVHDVLTKCTETEKLEIIPEGGDYPRVSRVNFCTKRGIRVSIEFDGDSKQDREGVFVMAWHTITDTDACMSHMFGNALRAEVNPHHHRKCTAVAYGFEDLLAKLNSVVECINSGDAYDAELEAEHVEKHGTWQDRKSRFQLMFQEAC